MKPANKVQVQRKRSPIKLIAGVAILAVIALAAFALTRDGPREGTFTVAPNAPQANPEGYVLGSPDAPVEVAEFADFECPACAQFATVTEPDVRQRLVETGQVRFRYFFFPLTAIHPAAASAAYAAACAGDQGRFWEMHDAIYAGFEQWAGGRARNPKSVFETYAERVGLDVAAWSECYDSDRHTATIQSHVTAGVQRGVGGTPTFFFNGREEERIAGYDDFKARVDAAIARARTAPAGGDTAVRDTTAAAR